MDLKWIESKLPVQHREQNKDRDVCGRVAAKTSTNAGALRSAGDAVRAVKMRQKRDVIFAVFSWLFVLALSDAHGRYADRRMNGDNRIR